MICYWTQEIVAIVVWEMMMMMVMMNDDNLALCRLRSSKNYELKRSMKIDLAWVLFCQHVILSKDRKTNR
jgi:hypothetical protein